MNHVAKKQGFTIIELMLAMAFVSTLLIAIAMTVIQISDIYNRGITLKNVNQAGRAVSSELQSSIVSSESFNIDASLDKNRYIVQDFGGRLCLTQYTYIWNYGYDLKIENNPNLNKYADPDADPDDPPIRLVKVADSNASYCEDPAKRVVKTDAIELLDDGEYDLSVHKLTVSTTSDDVLTPMINENTAGDSKTGQQLYSIELQVGTNDQDALLYDAVTGDPKCRLAGEDDDPNAEPNPSYCSISLFNFVARAGNKVD